MRRLLTLLLLAVAIPATTGTYVPDTLTVIVLDVGQDDPILFQAPNGEAMLIDSIESRVTTVPGLT